MVVVQVPMEALQVVPDVSSSTEQCPVAVRCGPAEFGFIVKVSIGSRSIGRVLSSECSASSRFDVGIIRLWRFWSTFLVGCFGDLGCWIARKIFSVEVVLIFLSIRTKFPPRLVLFKSTPFEMLFLVHCEFERMFKLDTVSNIVVAGHIQYHCPLDQQSYQQCDIGTVRGVPGEFFLSW